MLLFRNLAANAVTQIWAFLLNIIALPLYLRVLGPEPYALLGFALTLLAWTTLLDLGMSPTLSRDMARFRHGDLSEANVASFIRSLDWICFVLTAAVSVAGFLTRHWWAESWFQSRTIDRSVISDVMALAVFFCMLRWASSLYRSAVMGLERQVLANAVFTAANSIRILGALPVVYLTQDIRWLFLIWVAAAAAELIAYRWITARAFSIRLPLLHFSWSVLKERFRLAGSIAFLAVVWILITQIDKLILARVLPMEAYGYFTLAVVLANAMLVLPMPITQAFQPRLTGAAARHDLEELRTLFQMAGQTMAAVTLAPAAVLAFLPRTAIFAWTGNAVAAAAVEPFLGLYIVGSALCGLNGAFYIVQLAHGNMRMHVALNIVSICLFVPAMAYASINHGAVGAAWLWFVLNAGVFLVYGPIVLRRFVPGAARHFFLVDTGRAVAGAFLVCLAARLLFGDEPGSWFKDLLLLGGAGAAAFASAILASPLAASWLKARGWPGFAFLGKGHA